MLQSTSIAKARSFNKAREVLTFFKKRYMDGERRKMSQNNIVIYGKTFYRMNFFKVMIVLVKAN